MKLQIIFTEHARLRMRRRNISEEEILMTVTSPEKTRKIGNRYFSSKDIGRSVIEVVYEKETYIKIITVYYL